MLLVTVTSATEKEKSSVLLISLFLITIIDNNGERINWLHNTARSENEAVKKARVVAARGCYKNQIDSIVATECGIEYTYKTI